MCEKIRVFSREDIDGKDRGRIRDFFYTSDEVDVNKLKTHLNSFLQTMQSVVQSVPAKFGEFKLDTVTLTVEVSAKGTVSLLGTGGEFAGKGGLTFTLKRQPEVDGNGG